MKKDYKKPACYSIDAEAIVPIAATVIDPENPDPQPITPTKPIGGGFGAKESSYNAWDEELEDGFHQEDWRFRYKDAE